MCYGGQAAADERHDSAKPQEMNVTELKTPENRRKRETRKAGRKVVRGEANRRLHVNGGVRTGDDERAGGDGRKKETVVKENVKIGVK